jgi:parallel beta-helix repeat protein
MKGRLRVSRLWIAVLCSLLAGAAFLIAWGLTRDRWPAGTIFVPRDAATLALAVERVEPGGTIALDARRGPFAGGVTIAVPGVALCSAGGRARVEQESGVVVTVAADGVSVRGLDLNGPDTGILINASNCHVSDVALTSFTTAIDVASGSGNVVNKVSIRGGHVGILISATGTRLSDATFRDQSEAGVRAEEADGCVFRDLRFDSCPTAVSLASCSDAALYELKIQGADTGVELVESTRVRISACELASSRVGIHSQQADSITIEDSCFEALADSGVALAESKRTGISGSTFRSCAVGVRASGGGENALSGNQLLGSQRSPIVLQGEGNDLVSENTVRGGDVGISLDRCSNAQVLRNRVEETQSVGILLDRGDHIQALDNNVSRCAVGIAAVASTASSIKRNSVLRSDAAGIALLNGTLGNTASENRVVGGDQGFLLAGSSRDAVSENTILSCTSGVELRRIGFGTLVETNDISKCAVGLTWDDSTLADGFPLLRLGYTVDRAESATAPILVDNTFRDCRDADARNATSLALLAGGNQWSGSTARVLGRVSIPESGWRGTIALGSGTSTVDLVLGRLLEWMLAEDGVRVVDLVGLGPRDALTAALDRGDVNAVLWSVEDPPTDLPFWAVPARHGWSLIARAGVTPAPQEGSAAVSIAVPNGVSANLAQQAVQRAGLHASKIDSAETSAAAESLLKFGTVDCAILDRLEETVTLAGYVTLDTGDILPSTPIGLVVEGVTGEVGSTLRATFERLRSHLTDETVKNLVSRVRLLGRDPLDVTMEYLLREGLIGDSAEGGS